MIFTFDTKQLAPTSQAQPKAICPSCKKELSNSTHLSRASIPLYFAYLHDHSIIYPIVLRNCSHVICRTCADTLVRPSQQCSICDKPAKDKDVIHIEREGSSFTYILSDFVLTHLRMSRYGFLCWWARGDQESRRRLSRIGVSCRPTVLSYNRESGAAVPRASQLLCGIDCNVYFNISIQDQFIRMYNHFWSSSFISTSAARASSSRPAFLRVIA